jgi:hypothetical protein
MVWYNYNSEELYFFVPDAMDNPLKVTDGHWEGELTEVLVFDSKLTEKERKGVEEYLCKKWISEASY